MLGYSDSTKESGYVAANWLLHRAQADLAAVAARHDIELTLFHGRGGAIGRGGGQLELAVAAQPPGSVNGRLKLTEQGEVIWTRYGDPEIALQHLETLTAAAIDSLVGPEADADGSRDGPSVMDAARDGSPPRLPRAGLRRRRLRRVLRPDDADRRDHEPPARVAPGAAHRPGPALDRRPPRHPVGLRLVAGARRAAGVVRVRVRARGLPAHGARGGRASRRAVRGLAVLPVDRRPRPARDRPRGHGARPGIRGARERSRATPSAGRRSRPSTIAPIAALDRLPLSPAAVAADRAEAEAIRRSAALRAPYVDTLSVVQLELLRTLREREARDPADPTLPIIRPLIALTISGLSAALQGTG